MAVQYTDTLVREKFLLADQIEAIRAQVRSKLNETYDEAKKNREQFVIEEFAVMPPEEISQPIPSTAASHDTLAKVIEKSTSLPDGFHLHPKLKTLLERRRDALRARPSTGVLQRCWRSAVR